MSLENCYHDFDTLLLIDWQKASKGDLTRLRISGGTPELDIVAWENITSQHQEHFGMDKKHIRYLRLIKKITMLELDLVITEDQFILNHIEIAKEELEILQKQLGTGTDNTGDILISMSERAGYMVSENSITAKRFFEMVAYYNKKK